MSTFMVMITGSIESCQFAGIDELCCKYYFVFGDDWTYLSVCLICFFKIDI